ncbi:MAG: LexA family transcriptional regulator [Candidatus Hamiltonella defensa (Ceratovacuna japonica)]|nr:S24 family peptidase [Candidatus Hamiltonella defensa]AYB49589.1 transcriptional regulator [Candidatus Hamiltonella defensa]
MKTFGQRLRERRKELGITQKYLAKGVEVSHVTISQWEKEETSPKGENLYSLCRELKCQPDWLLYGKDDPKEAAVANMIPRQDIRRKVPLISWVQVVDWKDIMHNFQLGETVEWLETTANVGPNAFALKVRGDSMINPRGFPSIPEGAVVIVDPDVNADNGKIVVATLKETTELTLKKFVIDGPNKYLMSLNPDYRPIPIGINCTIVGVVKKVSFDL